MRQGALAVDIDHLDEKQKLHIVRMVYKYPAAGLVTTPLSLKDFDTFLSAHGAVTVQNGTICRNAMSLEVSA
jgi:hypothetical protein